MSTTEESVVAAPPLAVADPAPLGLAAFALTTFLLSAANAHWMTSATGDAWLGYAFAYGGLGQLLAGIYEFRNKNVFGATAFSTYAGFWIGLLAFAIFNTYMLLWSTAVNGAVFGVFLTLEATEIVLFIGFFANNTSIIKVGGYVGILTALVAWYASAAGVITGIRGRAVLPVGKPFGRLGS